MDGWIEDGVIMEGEATCHSTASRTACLRRYWRNAGLQNTFGTCNPMPVQGLYHYTSVWNVCMKTCLCRVALQEQTSDCLVSVVCFGCSGSYYDKTDMVNQPGLPKSAHNLS